MTQIRDATERYLHHLVGSADAGRELASTLALYSHPTEVALPKLSEERGSSEDVGAGASSPPFGESVHDAEHDAEVSRRMRELDATKSSLARVYRAMSALRASVMAAIQTLLRDAVLRPCEQILDAVHEGHRLYEKRKRYQTDVDSYTRRFEQARRRSRGEAGGHQDDVERLELKLHRAQGVLQEYTDRLADLLVFLEMQREDLIRQAGVASLAVQVHWFAHGAEALPTRTPYLPECASALVHLSHLTRSAASGEARRRGIRSAHKGRARSRARSALDAGANESGQDGGETDDEDEGNVPAWLKDDPEGGRDGEEVEQEEEGQRSKSLWSQEAPRGTPLESSRRGTTVGRRSFPSYPSLCHAMQSAVGKELPTEGRLYAGRVGGGDARRSEGGRRLPAERFRRWRALHETVRPAAAAGSGSGNEHEEEAIDSSSPRSPSPGT